MRSPAPFVLLVLAAIATSSPLESPAHANRVANRAEIRREAAKAKELEKRRAGAQSSEARTNRPPAAAERGSRAALRSRFQGRRAAAKTAAPPSRTLGRTLRQTFTAAGRREALSERVDAAGALAAKTAARHSELRAAHRAERKSLADISARLKAATGRSKGGLASARRRAEATLASLDAELLAAAAEAAEAAADFGTLKLRRSRLRLESGGLYAEGDGDAALESLDAVLATTDTPRLRRRAAVKDFVAITNVLRGVGQRQAAAELLVVAESGALSGRERRTIKSAQARVVTDAIAAVALPARPRDPRQALAAAEESRALLVALDSAGKLSRSQAGRFRAAIRRGDSFRLAMARRDPYSVLGFSLDEKTRLTAAERLFKDARATARGALGHEPTLAKAAELFAYADQLAGGAPLSRRGRRARDRALELLGPERLGAAARGLREAAPPPEAPAGRRAPRERKRRRVEIDPTDDAPPADIGGF